MKHLIFIAISASLTVSTAKADRPSAAYIFPAGAQKGTSVKFRVGGYNLHDKAGFQIVGGGVHGPKQIVKAKKTIWFEGPVIPMPASQAKEDYPKDQIGILKIDSDARIGIRRWRLWTSQGATQSLPFVIGDLPEVVEDEIDGAPIPSRVDLPVTINGRIFPREDVDIWTFVAVKGKRYTLRVDATSLGSPLDSRLVVHDSNGRRIAENDDGDDNDSFLQFLAPHDGVYSVRIHDTAFQGMQHYIYRLTIDDRPHFRYVFPLGGKRGTALKLSAWNSADDRGIFQVAIPGDAETVCRLPLTSAAARVNPVQLETSNLNEVVEPENNSSTDPVTLNWPTVCNGRIRLPGEVDGWRIAARKGQVLNLEVRAAQLGSPLDSTLSIHDMSGKQLAIGEDEAKGQTDSRLTFTVPADGEYDLRVREAIAGRAGDHFAYRLYITTVSTPQPGFDLSLAGDSATIDRGGQVTLQVTAKRKGRFNDAIKLQVSGLPAKVTVKSGDQIAAKKAATKLILQAEKDAVVDVSRIQIIATAVLGKQPVKRTALCGPVTSGNSRLDHCLLAVAMPTPFKVVGAFETKYGNRGSTYIRHYSLKREGFKGPVEVKLSDLQARHLQGVRGQRIIVPPNKEEFDFRIQLPPWMAIGRTSRTCVMAVGVVKDEQGKQHRVSYTSTAQNDQIIVLVDSSQLSVNCETPSVQANPGGLRDVTIRIARGQGISKNVKLELIVPEHIQGVAADPVVTGKPIAKLRIRFTSGRLGPFNMPLVVRVTAKRKGLPYTSEAKLQVVLPQR